MEQFNLSITDDGVHPSEGILSFCCSDTCSTSNLDSNIYTHQFLFPFCLHIVFVTYIRLKFSVLVPFFLFFCRTTKKQLES